MCNRWIYLLLISMWIYGSFFSAFSITSGILSALLIYSIIILIIPIIIIEFIFYAIRKFNTCNSCHNNKNSSNLVSKEHSQNSELTNNNTQEHSTTYTVESKKIKDEDIPHLIEMGLQHAIEREKSSNNPKFHRTNKEEELSFQFINNHSTEIQNHIDSFESRYRSACQENQIDKKIELLQQTIELYEKAKIGFIAPEVAKYIFKTYLSIYTIHKTIVIPTLPQ